LTSLLEVSQIS